MKNLIVTSVLFLVCNFGFSQDARNELSGKYLPPQTKEKLKLVKVIADLIPNCPTHWDKIIDLVSVEIITLSDGKREMNKGVNEVLTADQKSALNNADLCSDIVIQIFFKYKDASYAIGNYGAVQKMEYMSSVVPDVEAQYANGTQEMKSYLKENIFTKVNAAIDSTQRINITVKFTVNEQGRVADVKVSGKLTDKKVEKIVLEAMNNMSPWKPAQNSNGTKIKQDFQFNVTAGKGKGDGC